MPDTDEHVVGPRKQRQYLIGKRNEAEAALGTNESDVNSSGTEPISLAALRELLSKEPEITLLKPQKSPDPKEPEITPLETQRSPDQSEVLVVLMDPERAEQLKRQYPHLVIEENIPLDPLESC